MTTTTATTTTREAAPPRRLDLDSLADLDTEALGRLYADGRVRAPLSALDGHPAGRMLAVRALDHGGPAALLRRLAGAADFPWEGKSFTSRGEAGAGSNRVRLGGRHALFPFKTRIQPSVLDGRPCIGLDYDLADNPRLIRKIHDEVREVDDGLYLGPAMWRGASGPSLVLWFALDVRGQSRPIGG